MSRLGFILGKVECSIILRLPELIPCPVQIEFDALPMDRVRRRFYV
jgi:hypothetical protein